MSATIAEDTVPSMQRGLSDWWTEETEYVFQRIERWAAFARGYNRLRSQRYSRGRLTMTEEPVEPGWNISANKLVVEECTSWNPRFHNLQRSRRRKSGPEETRINCCGTFNYQSNNNLDSPCLETYRYDHSIYFKTIGDIRSGDRNRKCSLRRDESPDHLSPEESDQEQIEWRAKAIGEIECHRCDDDDECDVYEFLGNENKRESTDFEEINLRNKEHCEHSKSTKSSQVWPIVDLTQLDIKTDGSISHSGHSEGYRNHTIVVINDFDDGENLSNNNNNNDNPFLINNNNNNNNNENKNESEIENGNRNILQRPKAPDKITEVTKIDEKTMMRKKDKTSPLKEQEEMKKLNSLRRTRQSPRKVSQPTIVGENNVVWPGVLLNYKKNVDPVYSPHRHSIKK